MSDFSSSDPRDPNHFPPDRSPHTEDDTWVSDEEIKALAEERVIMGTDLEQQAEEILKQNLPAIVQSVVKLARSAQSETVRLNAGKYVIDRNLGRISDPEPEGEDALKQFLGDVVSEVQS